MSTSTFYIICFFFVLACAIYAAVLVHVPLAWIVIGGLIVNGAGILVASSYERTGA